MTHVRETKGALNTNVLTQRCPSALAPYIHARRSVNFRCRAAAFAEPTDNVQVALSAPQHECLSRKQIEAYLGARVVQRSPSVRILRMDVRLLREQIRDDAQMPVQSSLVQRGLSHPKHPWRVRNPSPLQK